MDGSPKEQLRETALRVQAELESYFALHMKFLQNRLRFEAASSTSSAAGSHLRKITPAPSPQKRD